MSRISSMLNKILPQEGKLKKNLLQIFLLTVSGSVIFGLPYFRFYFYDAFVSTFNLTNTQMGTLGSAYGFFGLVSYLLGGILADRFTAKRLIVFSLVVTGAGGIVHYFAESYQILLIIYSMWGFTSLLTFWPALIKAIRLTADSEEQGRVFGIFEGGRGAVNTINGSITIVIFGALGSSLAGVSGIKAVILYYALLKILLGFFVFVVLKEDKLEEPVFRNNKLALNNVIQALKHPAVWLVSLLLFATYAMNVSYFYFNPYATNILGATAVFASVMTMLAQYVRPFSSPLGGFLADKFGRANLMFIGYAMMGLGVGMLIMLPEGSGTLIVAAISSFIFIAMYMNYGVVLSLMDEGKIPLEISGTAIGIISTLGYLPEVIAPLIAGNILDRYPGAVGYNIYFTGLCGVMLIGCLGIVFWKRYIKTEQMNLKKSEDVSPPVLG